MTEANSAAPSDSQQISGVIIQAHDGTLYFIPDKALTTFRVTSSNGKSSVQSKFDSIESGAEAAPHLEAFHVTLPDTLFSHSEIFR